MPSFMTLIVWTTLSLWQQATSLEQCDLERDQGENILANHVIERIEGSTRALCWMACDAKTQCHSINFFLNTETCELNNATHLSHPEDMVKDVPGGSYMLYPLHPLFNCSNKLCKKKERCEVDPNGSTIKCIPVDCALFFPNGGEDDYIIVNGTLPAMTSFTVSFWIKVPSGFSSNFSATVFSYIDTNEHYIMTRVEYESAIRLYLRGTYLKWDGHMIYDQWQHHCLTVAYSVERDRTYMESYLNGNSLGKEYKGSDLRVLAGGRTIIGQRQKRVDELSFSGDSMFGYISGLNIYNNMSDGAKCVEIFGDGFSGNHYGDVLSWVNVVSGEFVGSVKEVCSSDL
ncbi:sushi, von Willebrand factor type A, EGF and pentraxin domain-containing protein 1 [Nematostella vectensis]|uniref:sushi, von Willebrand factor type A, EGF and pentraxin domain-containing protein 1 n=1 Tax=Nematostella vectensis TaxID=45351 RepID=UPI0020770F66|nr:sushi, von Willebrand factor type A, EGF and pentraxin domain-containing protein 1 [Nematostella vectensis]